MPSRAARYPPTDVRFVAAPHATHPPRVPRRAPSIQGADPSVAGLTGRALARKMMPSTPLPAAVVIETLGEVKAEIHRVVTEDGAELALTRIPPLGSALHSAPVVFVHGNYARRNFWASAKGVGLAPYLAERGHDCWVVELRGHGSSPKGEHFAAVTAEDHMRRDLPAVQSHVDTLTRQPAFWIAHSAGGVYVLGALAMGWLDGARTRGVTTFGSQVRDGERYLRIPGVAALLSALLRRIGHLPAPSLGLGPEIEPAGEMIEFIRWKSGPGKWVTSDGVGYPTALRGVSVPIQSIAGSGDRNDPPRGCRALLECTGSREPSFVELGRRAGFSKDYGHVDMVVSKEAAVEVWPLVAAWLAAH